MLTALDSTDIAWDINEHFVDMMVCVGRGLGLGLIILNQEVNLLYQINLDFGHRHRVFHAKYAKLGFCGNNSLLWIGKTASSSDIWIAWAPEERGEEEEEEECSNTMLSEHHYRAMVMLFAKMLSMIGYRDLIVRDEYPDLMDEGDFMFVSNIM